MEIKNEVNAAIRENPGCWIYVSEDLDWWILYKRFPNMEKLSNRELMVFMDKPEFILLDSRNLQEDFFGQNLIRAFAQIQDIVVFEA